jgi:membrane-associated PAP2 superfamily phosphatase
MAPERMLSPRALALLGAGLAAAALAILWLGACTNVDLVLADAMFEPGHGFPWRDAWLANTFSHGILKDLLLVLAMLAVLAAGWDMARPFAGWPQLLRLRVRAVALAAVAVPLVVSMLKRASSSHCPWDLARYGGAETYVRLLDRVPWHTIAGHCLPAGHASSALWLVAVAAFWLPASPRKALAAALGALALGFGLGWMQQLRGAHFLTHTLWSMWLACAIVTAILACLPRFGTRPGTAAAPLPQSGPGSPPATAPYRR